MTTLVSLEARLPQPLHVERVLSYALGGAVAGTTLVAILAGSGDHRGEMAGLAVLGAMFYGSIGGLVIGAAVGAMPPLGWEPIDFRSPRTQLGRPASPLGLAVRWRWGGAHSKSALTRPR
jgi:hypothetical protein